METPEDNEPFITIGWTEIVAIHHLVAMQVFIAWGLHTGIDGVKEYLKPFGYSVQDVAAVAKKMMEFRVDENIGYTYAEYQRMVFATSFTGVFVMTNLGETLLQKEFEKIPYAIESMGRLNLRQQFLKSLSGIMKEERNDAPNNLGMVAFFEKVDAFLDLEQMEREFG